MDGKIVVTGRGVATGDREGAGAYPPSPPTNSQCPPPPPAVPSTKIMLSVKHIGQEKKTNFFSPHKQAPPPPPPSCPTGNLSVVTGHG